MLYRIVNTSNQVWAKAKKTQCIHAKPVSALLSDLSLIGRVLLSTLEGNEQLRTDSMICKGFQQTP